ncbi:uncharacterized protein ycf36 isoform X2 [Solanum stenotomum]|uniref:uncharacterized protein ycf36 isoform X2 n=1 Tax=Solanum stenotomum TaxID=172797 RepID=UPI0020D11D57|nr:uncharacterized protein ycf36 isoform X2 [Solanum stenotomum]
MQMAISVATPFSPNHQPFCFPSSSTQYLKIHHFHNQRFIPRIPFSSFRNNNPLPETECPVPLDQQPVNEFKTLSDSFPFSWASGDLVEYCSRLFATGLAFALFVGLPVNLYGSAGPIAEPLKPFLGAVSGGLIVVTLAVVRMYLGWAYVDEETGWYDGQIWVKTPEVLARDRLLGSFSVKPVLSRLKNTLVVLATSLLVCVVVFVNIENGQKDSYIPSEEAGGRSVPGVYNDESARSFEPDAFCGGEPADP